MVKKTSFHVEVVVMSAVMIPSKQRFILENVTWQKYTGLLHVFEDRRLRLTYDRGILEIMTLSFEHEKDSHFLGRLVVALTEELNLPVRGGKSTTFRRKKHKRGLEADGCWWIANEHLIRRNKTIDLRKDPPPDLALEVDVTKSSLDRMGIYAKLKVPEVWREKDQKTTFLILNKDGTYEPSSRSLAFPQLTSDDLMPFLVMFESQEENSVVALFRIWVRQHLVPKKTAADATSSTIPSPAE